MSYVKRTMLPDEKVKIIAKLHWIRLRWYFLWICLIPFTFGFSLIPLFIIWLKFRCLEMVCTNKRCICREGIISIDVNELRNKKIESIELKYNLLGRILGYADLHITGTGASTVIFRQIANPWKVKASIEEVVDR